MPDGTGADLYPVEEEDADYLRRLGLLRPDEKEKLEELSRQREEWKQQWARSPDLAFERDQQDAGNGGWREAK